jgi:7-cyano-7-deazaguanine synthase
MLAVYKLLQNFSAKLYEVPLPFLQEVRTNNLPEGYIPNRNMTFYTIAAYYAARIRFTTLVGGHTAEDQDPFPDAALPFFEALQNLINQALLDQKIKIELPLAHFTKREVLVKAVEWKVPLEQTWSCYRDRSDPCGKCVSCRERAEVFHELGINDPLDRKLA